MLGWKYLTFRNKGGLQRTVACAGLACMVGAVVGCLSTTDSSPDPFDAPILSDNGWVPEERVLPKGWPTPTIPADNPYTPTKVILGRRLFRETALGRDGTSCQWCHDPATAFAFKHGGLGGNISLTPTLRGPPTLINVAFASSLMSDGSASSLEEQILLPLFSPDEMNMTALEIEARLTADTGYVHLFRQAFGTGSITLARVVQALAAYQRTLISYRSDYDRWQAGDSSALSAEAKQGAALFLGKADCKRCHTPPLFTDGSFHNIGIDSIPIDKGRMNFTGRTEDAGRFKTPTLRNLILTSPYMHDGRFENLEQVVKHYSDGRRGHGADVERLNLTDREQFELVEFLKSLVDPTIFTETSF